MGNTAIVVVSWTRVISWVFLVCGIRMRLVLFGFHLSVKIYEPKIMSPTILAFHPNWSEHSILYVFGTKSLQPLKTLNSQFRRKLFWI
jgi:hypothetical protein